MTLAAVAPIISAALARQIFPGAVVLIAADGVPLHHAAYGAQTYAPDAPPITPDTIYDLASLTKLFTAAAALRLVDAGALRLHIPAAHYLPTLAATNITIAQLLTHSSGLDLRLSALRDQPPASIRAAALAAPQRYPPGAVVAYSNINSLLLGWIVERLTGQPLDQAIERLVCAPLGLVQTRFCPPLDWRDRIPPTEIDSDWRGAVVQGAVHDESAFALGGVAGHAGMFGPAAEIARFAGAWLAAIAGDSSWISPALARDAVRNWTVPEFSPRRNEETKGTKAGVGVQSSLACGLGWMLDRPSFMGTAPAGSFGHTGFTGPALVVLPATRTVTVILSNRTYPRRTPAAHHAVTAALVEVATALTR